MKKRSVYAVQAWTRNERFEWEPAGFVDQCIFSRKEAAEKILKLMDRRNNSDWMYNLLELGFK